MSGHLKNILTLLLAVVIIVPLIAILTLNTREAASGLKGRLAAKAALAEKVREARALGLTYDSAMAAPAAALGKTAVWCLSNPDKGRRIFYEGNETRPVYMNNQTGIPEYPLPHRSTCADALVEITTFTAYSFGDVSARRIEVRLIAYP
ncbi:MAG: hypothetical protein A2049_07830 [Elusimicrobia bacterium GWA2_62_23]|nr:MAG: hypothetical protein A2049_07830 [Elusimicrobia bacterium GWA2_62_23]OGR69396.1 MAG: hypothetical protein A2179_02995 [Elusimicrobia bacterium GWC2_63_65]